MSISDRRESERALDSFAYDCASSSSFPSSVWERKAVKQSTVFRWSFIDTTAKFNFGLERERERVSVEESEELATGVSNHMQFPVAPPSLVQYTADQYRKS